MSEITGEFYVLERQGKRVNVSEEYSRRTESGEWEKTGRGYLTLWLRNDDAHPEVDEGAVVLASGRLRIDKVEKQGKTYTNVNVSVNHIGVVRLTSKYVGRGFGGGQGGSNDGWAADTSSNNSGPSGGQQATAEYDSLPPF